MSELHTHYDNLQVERDAPAELIHASFITLLRKYDPAIHPGSTEAIRITKVLEASYAVLSNPDSRKAYDQALAVHEVSAKVKTVELASPSVEKMVMTASQKVAPLITSHQPNYPSAIVRNKGADSWVYVVLGLSVFGFLFYLITGGLPSSSGNYSAPMSPSTAETSKAATVWSADWVVASSTANFRKAASGQSKLLQKLARGTGLRKVGEANGFIHAENEKGEVGFVYSDQLIPKNDYERLKNLTPEDFIKANSDAESSVKKLEMMMAKYGQPMDEIFRSLPFRDPAVHQHVDKLDSARDEFLRFSAGQSFDIFASKWFYFQAVQARAEEDYYRTSINYLAAKIADPSSPGIDSAVVFSGYELLAKNNTRTALINNALWAVLKEPKTANAWVAMGLTMAMAGQTPENNVRLASGAFLLAMRYSKSVDVTRKYLSNLAINATETNVKKALEDALAESPQGPPSF